MKKETVSMLLSLVTLFITGWCIAALLQTYTELSHVIKNPEPPWEINLNLLPLFVLALYTLTMIFVYLRKKKNNRDISFWLFPLEFSERDEREKQISGEACRKAFISTWYTAPSVAALFVFYPLIHKDIMYYYPIVLIFLIPAVQIITYYVHIRRIG